MFFKGKPYMVKVLKKISNVCLCTSMLSAMCFSLEKDEGVTVSPALPTQEIVYANAYIDALQKFEIANISKGQEFIERLEIIPAPCSADDLLDLTNHYIYMHENNYFKPVEQTEPTNKLQRYFAQYNKVDTLNFALALAYYPKEERFAARELIHNIPVEEYNQTTLRKLSHLLITMASCPAHYRLDFLNATLQKDREERLLIVSNLTWQAANFNSLLGMFSAFAPYIEAFTNYQKIEYTIVTLNDADTAEKRQSLLAYMQLLHDKGLNCADEIFSNDATSNLNLLHSYLALSTADQMRICDFVRNASPQDIVKFQELSIILLPLSAIEEIQNNAEQFSNMRHSITSQMQQIVLKHVNENPYLFKNKTLNPRTNLLKNVKEYGQCDEIANDIKEYFKMNLRCIVVMSKDHIDMTLRLHEMGMNEF